MLQFKHEEYLECCLQIKILNLFKLPENSIGKSIKIGFSTL